MSCLSVASAICILHAVLISIIYQHNRYKYFRLFGLRLIRLRHPRGKPSFFSPLLLFPSLPLVLPVFFCLGVEYMCWKGVLRNVCAS